MTEASEQVKGHTPEPPFCAWCGGTCRCETETADYQDCPRCGGDCSAANPPVIACPLRAELAAAISRTGAA